MSSISDQESMESANRPSDVPESEASAKEEASAAQAMPRVSKTVAAPSGFISKHKLRASISCLESQVNLILEELEELETTGTCNSVCSELLTVVDSTPDPLLPLTESHQPQSLELILMAFDRRQDKRAGGCELRQVVWTCQKPSTDQALDLITRKTELTPIFIEHSTLSQISHETEMIEHIVTFETT
ncbi:Guanine nucleotide-binding protein subunit gamma 1-like protein [Drosera capensis]